MFVVQENEATLVERYEKKCISINVDFLVYYDQSLKHLKKCFDICPNPETAQTNPRPIPFLKNPF
jgi:plastocyanin domain-containing protein